MPRIDFYTLEPDSGGDRFLLACRLIERIRAQALRVLVHCPDPEQARHLDRLLWTFREDSFLPHGLIGQVDHALTPVLIGDVDRAPDAREALVNLSETIPASLGEFERVCELVDLDPACVAAGRVRYRQYREQGHALEHHRLRL